MAKSKMKPQQRGARPKTPKAKPRRKPGRPAAADGTVLDANKIFACGYHLARNVPLQEISVVLVARELGVTPALIHYYIKGRDSLTSSVMNTFYRDVCASLPQPSGTWRYDLETASRIIYRHFVERAGIASYVVSHNKFRTFQLVDEFEVDYGIRFQEDFTELVRRSEAGARKVAIYAHLLLEFIAVSAYATSRHRWPSESRLFLERKLASLDARAFPNMMYVQEHILKLDSEIAFSEGLKLYLDGLASNQATK